MMYKLDLGAGPVPPFSWDDPMPSANPLPSIRAAHTWHDGIREHTRTLVYFHGYTYDLEGDELAAVQKAEKEYREALETKRRDRQNEKSEHAGSEKAVEQHG